MPAPERFYWSGRDIEETGTLARALATLGRADVGDLLIKSSVDIQVRGPMLADAWAFFRAAHVLLDARLGPAATAQRIGARLALAATGLLVFDMIYAECGTSDGYGLYVRGAESQPVIARTIQADGLTDVEVMRAGLGRRVRP